MKEGRDALPTIHTLTREGLKTVVREPLPTTHTETYALRGRNGGGIEPSTEPGGGDGWRARASELGEEFRRRNRIVSTVLYMFDPRRGLPITLIGGFTLIHPLGQMVGSYIQSFGILTYLDPFFFGTTLMAAWLGLNALVGIYHFLKMTR